MSDGKFILNLKKKKLYGFTNIRSKRGRKMHFEDDNTTFCVKNRRRENFVSGGKFRVYFFNKI